MSRSRIVILFGIVLAVGAVLCGCTSVSPAQYPLCGPRPTLFQARLAASDWVAVATNDPPAVMIRNVHIGKRGRLWHGLIGPGADGGYTYGWWVKFAANVPNIYGGHVGYCPTTILWNAKTGAYWKSDARSCY